MIIERDRPIGRSFFVYRLCTFIAMKYTLAILFVLFGSIAFGQKYNACEIYRYEKNDSTHQSLECTRVFNKEGKIVHEEVRNYSGFDDGLDDDFYRDGTKDYYYEKGLLRLIKYSGVEYYKVDYPDTIITRFYYNDSKKLKREIAVHRIYGYSGIDTFMVDDGPPDGIMIKHTDTLDSTMTIFDYDKQGKIVSKKWYDKWDLHSNHINIANFIRYDELDRVTVDSIVHFDIDSPSNYDEPLVNTFVYNSQGYIFYLGKGHYGKTEFILDDKKRVIERSVFLDTAVTRETYYRDVTEYMPDGRIAKIRHYNDKGELAVTHVFVYKRIAANSANRSSGRSNRFLQRLGDFIRNLFVFLLRDNYPK